MSKLEELGWKSFSGPNLAYAQGLYEQYLSNPDSVSETWKQRFVQWGEPVWDEPAHTTAATGQSTVPSVDLLFKAGQVGRLAAFIRTYGHLASDIDPLDDSNIAAEREMFDPHKFGLTQEDLKMMPAKLVWEDTPAHIRTADEALDKLKEAYMRKLAFQFTHVHDEEERHWLYRMVETGEIQPTFSNQQRIDILNRLIEVDTFENFLHRTFVGQKRFSVEGVDALIPMLDRIVDYFSKQGAEHISMGMAHRGRLNVLAHVLGKPYKAIFSEFHRAPDKDLVPSEGSMGISYGWSGDVKYHMGANRSLNKTRITLAHNPSHLEFVNPVVQGFARAAQEDRTKSGFPQQDKTKALGILVHGDAAFPGEGVVAESLNLSALRGYQTGGTIHIIANNRIGFTTESSDSRSTKYASDLAKGFEIPVVHVNADDPEACMAAVQLACLYRERYNKDFIIDLIGYRRYGHNEMDDPSATQPLLYDQLSRHLRVNELYFNRLLADGCVQADYFEEQTKRVHAHLQQEFEETRLEAESRGSSLNLAVPEVEQQERTLVPLSTKELTDIQTKLLEWPEEFAVYPKIEKILQRRLQLLDKEQKVDWATAETLAFATLLKYGTPIRISGQDSQRGTFAHRHLVLHDVKSNQNYSPLHTLDYPASFAIHNSPLSEMSVLGFEYGYNVFSPETLVIWEAQYGDFANCAQVIFDQFLSAGKAKWKQLSNLVMLLPHGYEGQGPEHSSARLERFLQSSAENNWTVAYLSSAAQYYHLLLQQGAACGQSNARPLILMAPKSLIRHQLILSQIDELSGGSFQPVMVKRPSEQSEQTAKRLVLCTGKVAVELQSKMNEAKDRGFEHLELVSVEQLYPFPKAEIEQLLARYSNLEEIVWVQEEPENMGAWRYMEPKLKALPGDLPVSYIGRQERSSPAGGLPEIHKIEQEYILTQALKKPAEQVEEQGVAARGH